MDKIIPDQNIFGYFDVSDAEQLDDIADGIALDIPNTSKKPKVVVTIPAHNEENLIGNCIESLAVQRTIFGKKIDLSEFEILILCHNCTDSTYEMSLKTWSRFPDLNLTVLEICRPDVNNVGAVRRILMRIASSRIYHGQGYIAMTDADTLVHPFWISNIIGYIGSGYGLICGRIDLDTDGISDRAKRILAQKAHYEELRTLLNDSIFPIKEDPLPRHGDNAGPNMAVRADVYDRVGGIAPLGFCEDIAFYDEIIWGGFKVRHCPLTIVTTSGRTEPRAPWGFGAQLSVWGGNSDVDFPVEGLDAQLERFRIYELAREYSIFNNERVLWEAIRRSGIGRDRLLGHIDKFPTYRALFHRLEKDLDISEDWRVRYPKIDISRACNELEAYLSLPSNSFRQTCKR